MPQQTAPVAILRLDGLEITTSDEVCVRTLWNLMQTAVRPADAAVLAGGRPRAVDREQVV